MCMGEKAKEVRLQSKQQDKQARDKAKANERSKQPNSTVKPVSKQQSAINAEKSRIKKRMQLENNICFTCESAAGETLSHIITAKNKKFELIPSNLVLECFFCHSLFENYKAAYANQYPDKWQIKLERAKQLSEEQYQKLKDKAE